MIRDSLLIICETPTQIGRCMDSLIEFADEAKKRWPNSDALVDRSQKSIWFWGYKYMFITEEESKTIFRGKPVMEQITGDVFEEKMAECMAKVKEKNNA